MALDTPGLLAGRYRKLETLGVGGMARVFLAEDERLGRRVAVKQLHAESPAATAERFEREAKLGALLNHPNLVSVYDITADSETVLIVMEYVDGETLGDAIAEGPLNPARMVAIVHDVAAALNHAHSHGVVHRDVKPANILLRRDRVTKLADLGIATAAQSTSLTKSGMVLGTAAYLAPEQLDGERAGPAADIYALGAVAFEAASGRKARTGETPMEIAHAVVSGPPPDLREAWPQAPAGAAEAIARAMAIRPEDRPASAGEFATALQRGLREEGAAPSTMVSPPTALPESPPAATPGESPPPPREAIQRRQESLPPAGPRRRPPSWLPATLALVALCVLAVVGIAALGGGGDDDGADADRAGQAASGKRVGSGDSGKDGAGSGSSSGPGAGSDSGSGAPAPAPGSPSGGAPAGNPAALNSQGFKLMGQGRYEEAIPLLQRAVAAYPSGSKELTYAFSLYNLGKSLRLAGRPREAVPILERRLRIPNQTETVRRELEAARRAAG